MNGKKFEAWINAEIMPMMKAREIVAWQLPTPYNILKDLGKGRFEGIRQRSTIDYIGAVKPHGRLFAIEAKSTDNGKLSIQYSKSGRGSGVKRHQLNALANIAAIGGDAWIVVHDTTTDKTFALPVYSGGNISGFDSGIKTIKLCDVPMLEIESLRDLLLPSTIGNNNEPDDLPW